MAHFLLFTQFYFMFCAGEQEKGRGVPPPHYLTADVSAKTAGKEAEDALGAFARRFLFIVVPMREERI